MSELHRTNLALMLLLLLRVVHESDVIVQDVLGAHRFGANRANEQRLLMVLHFVVSLKRPPIPELLPALLAVELMVLPSLVRVQVAEKVDVVREALVTLQALVRLWFHLVLGMLQEKFEGVGGNRAVRTFDAFEVLAVRVQMFEEFAFSSEARATSAALEVLFDFTLAEDPIELLMERLHVTAEQRLASEDFAANIALEACFASCLDVEVCFLCFFTVVKVQMVVRHMAFHSVPSVTADTAQIAEQDSCNFLAFVLRLVLAQTLKRYEPLNAVVATEWADFGVVLHLHVPQHAFPRLEYFVAEVARVANVVVLQILETEQRSRVELVVAPLRQ